MNISSSEYSSGCESGWTMYLDQHSNSGYCNNNNNNNNQFVSKYEEKHNGEEDEDLSMVSDASSGPPQFHYQSNSSYADAGASVYSQYYGYYTPEQDKKKSNNKSKTKDTVVSVHSSKKKQHNLCLDDTASSPVFDHFSQDNVPPDFTQQLSSAQYEGEFSMTKKRFGFFKSSTKGKSRQFDGKKEAIRKYSFSQCV
ncbi:hypothetical protein CASFOL_021176 [Castilleja foliolosa]|uniref:Uncharacterized protein n=1 Tax=Castilleja foliolosa TaxID=1961234 RepID=A0ABD3CWR8_9LAMI